MWEEPPIDISQEEIWVISRERNGRGPDYAIIKGDELRHVVREAKKVRADRGASGAVDKARE